MVFTKSEFSKIPRGSGIIERPRLMEKLQKAWTHKLTLITAPPGYGKTTLAAQFAKQQSGRVVWHTIDAREHDVANLYNACLSALAEYQPYFRDVDASYSYAPTELGALVADYLHNNLRDDIIFILDDVHVLAGATAAEVWLRTLVALMPPACHLILLSRIVPDLPLIDMIARREVLAIGQEELRLTTQEIQWLGNTLLDTPPSGVMVQQLEDQLEGWPAGIALALQPLPSDLQIPELKGKDGPEGLFGALARNMLDAQPLALQHFLLASSTLSRITPELCSKALGLPNSIEFLAEVQARNMFLSRSENGLIYHSLFRSFLQSQLAADAPELYITLHKRVAQWFEDNDLLDDAFSHYMTIGEVSKAAAVAERVVHAYFAEGKIETLLDWNNQLSAVGVQIPQLWHRCAIIHTDRYEYTAAENELRRAEIVFLARGDKAGSADVKLQQATLKLQQGAYQEAKALVANLVDTPADITNIRGRSLNVLGGAYLQTGDADTAVNYLEKARSLYREYADAYAQSQHLQSLGLAYWRMGRLTEALGCLQEVVSLLRSLGGASSLAAGLNYLGYYYGQLGDYQQALAALQEGLSILARLPNKRYESYLLLNLADIQRNRGAYTEAASLYRRALESLGSGEPSLRCTLLINLSTLQRWQGNLLDAVSLAETAVTLAERHEVSMEGNLARMALLAAFAQQGHAEQVTQELGRIGLDLRQRGENFALLHGLAICAHVAELSGDRAGAIYYLQSATSHAKKLGTTQPLVIEILHSSVLEALLESNRRDYAPLLRDLQNLRNAQIRMVEDTQAAGLLKPVTCTLRVFCLGQIRILRDGEPIDTVTLRRVGRDIFLYLLFAGPATREEISTIFWPDSSPHNVRQNFHTMMFRIRQALGENVIILQNHLYQFNSAVEIWCDAQEIEKLAQKARLLSPRDVRTEDMWRRAVGLYGGDFLPEVDAEWAASRREGLREIYIDALVGMGECARVRNDIIEALTIFKHASELEPYREDIHQRTMTCYATKGDKHKIITHLSKLKTLLRRDLGVEPSKETLILAKELLK